MSRLLDDPRVRYPLLALGMLSLIAGMWAGLLRIGWLMAPMRHRLVLLHGPLMVCGFLGTLISLERAVALGRVWGYFAPALCGLGALLLIVGIGSWEGALLITAGSAVLLLIFGAVLRIQAQPFALVMMLGAVAWAVGNVLWLLGSPVFTVVWWWMGFLVLTIAGERLELSRMLLHKAHVQNAFLAIVAIIAAGLITASAAAGPGGRVIGFALVLLGLWLFRYDVARRTIRQRGLTRFIAACLIAGYVWLVIGGGLLLAYGGATGGLVYDAILHAVLVGFVFSMIFGHAPIIFPSVLGVPVAYHPFYYLHLAALHLSLVARMSGDLAAVPALRQWGGMLNAAAIALFLMATVFLTLRARFQSAAGQAA